MSSREKPINVLRVMRVKACVKAVVYTLYRCWRQSRGINGAHEGGGRLEIKETNSWGRTFIYVCFLRGANDFSVVAMELNTCEEITCNCWNQSSDNHLCLSSAVFKIAKAEVNFEKLLACLVSKTSIAICFNLLQFFFHPSFVFSLLFSMFLGSYFYISCNLVSTFYCLNLV